MPGDNGRMPSTHQAEGIRNIINTDQATSRISSQGTAVADGVTLLDLLTALNYVPGEEFQVCEQPPGGRFQARCSDYSPGWIRALPEDRDVWFGVNPVNYFGTGRPDGSVVTRLAAVWADLDVKVGACPDMETADLIVQDLAGIVGAYPVAITYSGHGLQPLWAVEDAPVTDANRAAMRKLLRRWGRLVAAVAERRNVKVDSVFDLPRLLRAPGTWNLKDTAHPVAAYAVAGQGAPVSLETIGAALDAYGIAEYRGDGEDIGAVVSAPTTWRFAEQTHPYVSSIIAAWLTEIWPARHPFFYRCSVRLNCAYRCGRISEADYDQAVRDLTAHFHLLLDRSPPRRQATPGEIRGIWMDGQARAAAKSDGDALADCSHRPDNDADPFGGGLKVSPVNGSLKIPGAAPIPVVVTQVADVAAGSTPSAPFLVPEGRGVGTGNAVPATPAGRGQLLHVDVAALLNGGLPEPPKPLILTRDDGHAIFYAGQVNTLFGESESGKTFIALAAIAEVAKAGRRTAFVDIDHNGVEAIVSRLLALGVPTEYLGDPGRFRYWEATDKGDLRDLVAFMVETWKPTLVVVDSVGELLPLFGGNSNSPDDFTMVHAAVLKPMAAAGAAVVIIDHLAKGTDSKAAGPTGTAAKKRAVGGVSIRVTVHAQFVPGQGGSAFLAVNKDRHGGLRRHCARGDREPSAGLFTLTVERDRLVWNIRAPKDTDGAEMIGASTADLAALRALDPAAHSVKDVKDRLSWGTERASKNLAALRAEREANKGTRPLFLVPEERPGNEERDPDNDQDADEPGVPRTYTPTPRNEERDQDDDEPGNGAVHHDVEPGVHHDEPGVPRTYTPTPRNEERDQDGKPCGHAGQPMSNGKCGICIADALNGNRHHDVDADNEVREDGDDQ